MLTRVFGRRKNMWGLVIHTRLHAPTAGGDARKCVLRTTRLDAALSSIPTRIMPNREEESCVPGAQWFFCFRNPRARNLNEAPIPFQPAPSQCGVVASAENEKPTSFLPRLPACFFLCGFFVRKSLIVKV
jgi:hypothetical protein